MDWRGQLDEVARRRLRFVVLARSCGRLDLLLAHLAPLQPMEPVLQVNVCPVAEERDEHRPLWADFRVLLHEEVVLLLRPRVLLGRPGSEVILPALAALPG